MSPPAVWASLRPRCSLLRGGLCRLPLPRSTACSFPPSQGRRRRSGLLLRGCEDGVVVEPPLLVAAWWARRALHELRNAV